AVLAAFGIPQAHEDDAERAVRAALAMLDSVAELGLEARVGVESGEVVVDEADSTFATGEAVTLAARLQQAAGAGEVLLGPHAQEFVDGLERATVLVGRALPYGESVTYWPLAEMVKSAAGITDDDPLEVAVEKLRESCENEAIADLLGLASGVLEAVKGERS